jgi:hypothetical protein
VRVDDPRRGAADADADEAAEHGDGGGLEHDAADDRAREHADEPERGDVAPRARRPSAA